MSRWRAESAYVGRYLGTGAFNTLVGFGVIFALMWAGVPPVAANIAGYACGFVLGFVLSRRLVFASRGSALGESGRYLLAFLAAFALNLLVLKLALGRLSMPPVPAQLAAAVAYTAAMYALSRGYVFSPGAASLHRPGMTQRPSPAMAAALAALAAAPMAFACFLALATLPDGMRLLATGLAMAILVPGAMLLRQAFSHAGAARAWLLAATLLLGVGLFAAADVEVQSAQSARVHTSDGRQEDGVRPAVLSAWGREVTGYGLHPAFAGAVVADAVQADFPSRPGEVTLLFAKPRDVLFDADGQPTPSDGISVAVATFDAQGRVGPSETFLIPQQRFLEGGWIEHRVLSDEGIASVRVAIGTGPPGSTPGWDSTLVGFEATPWHAPIALLGKVMLACLGFLVIALALVLNLAAWVTRWRGGSLRSLFHAGLVLSGLLLVVGWSQANTSYVYFWDYRNYWEKTEALHALMAAGAWRQAVDLFTSTYTSNYSMLPAVGPALLALVTGSPTRIHFALSVTALYAAPAFIMVSLLARRLLDGGDVADDAPARRGWVLASVAVVAGLPVFLGTTLYLMPDIGGVIAFVAALLSASTLVDALRQPAAQAPAWPVPKALLRASLGLGVLLALMFVFRRWYAFAAAGIAFSLAALVLLEIVLARAPRALVLRRAFASAVLVAFAALPLLCWFMFAWSSDPGRHDYATLYASYRVSLAQDARLIGQLFGVVVPLLCLAGGVLLCRQGRDRRLFFLVLGSTAVAVLLFLQVQSPGRHHYFLLMPLMGSFLAGLCLLLARRFGTLAPVGLTLALVLGGVLATRSAGEAPGVTAFAAFDDLAPRKQHNAAGLAELSRWLDAPGNADQKFCLVASSVALNQGLFAELWQILPNVPKAAYAARMVRLGQVDSVDGPPWPGVRDCGLFLVGVPFQAHLPSGRQSTLEIVQHDLVEGAGIGAAVDRKPAVFALGDGVEVWAYRTIRPVTAAEYDDLVRRFREGEAAPAR